DLLLGASATARASTRQTKGTQSHSRTYQVRSSEDRIVRRRIAGSNRPVRATIRPVGSMYALSPETASCTTQRPSSTALIWLIWTCWGDAAVVRYEASSVVITRNVAPARTNALSICGKLFSKQIGVPKAGTEPVLIATIESPGVLSTGICFNAEMKESFERHGTYSPKGTRWTFL